MDSTKPSRTVSPKLVGVAVCEDLLTTNEFFIENFKVNYSEDIDCLKEFAAAIQNNLVRNIMTGNLVLPKMFLPSLS